MITWIIHDCPDFKIVVIPANHDNPGSKTGNLKKLLLLLINPQKSVFNFLHFTLYIFFHHSPFTIL